MTTDTQDRARSTPAPAPGALRSALYPGVVQHRRRGEVDHDLDARVVMALFDLDELEILDQRVRGFGVDRAAPVSFRARDHGHGDGSSLRGWLEEVTARAGVVDVSGPARVLCMPRVLGYAFDPLSVWFCHDGEGRLTAVVHEVRNTFGGRHAYVVPDPLSGRRGPDSRVLTHHADKAFHVSPFFDVDGDYDFTLAIPDDTASIGITHHAGDGHTLTASFVGRRRAFTTRGLWQSMLRHPALSHRVMAGIHVEAGKLWRKGATYRPVPEPGDGVTIATATTADTSGATPSSTSTDHETPDQHRAVAMAGCPHKAVS